MQDIVAAARFLVKLSYGEKNYSLTHSKLQKLLYLAQGWSFVWDDKPAFPEEFEAWQSGPVNGSVFSAFGKYGHAEIPEEEGADIPGDPDLAETLRAVWGEYGHYTAFDLSKMISAQEPWSEGRRSLHGKIPNESIRSYFRSAYAPSVDDAAPGNGHARAGGSESR